jgi:hypothetical protein
MSLGGGVVMSAHESRWPYRAGLNDPRSMRCVRVDGATSSRLLHPPYTAWHLSYVAIGAAATPQLHADRLAAALGAFLLGVSVCAHALHELNGRPLGTRLSDRSLVALAVVGLAGRGRHRDRRRGHGVGGPGAVRDRRRVHRGGLQPRAARWAIHTDVWFAASWEAFLGLTGYWINALDLRPQGLLVAAACFTLSVAQRRLSKPARELRRRTASISGRQQLTDGTVIELDAARVAAPLDAALGACALAIVLLAVGMVVARL